MPSELLTSGQVAEILGVRTQTVSKWVRQGWITPAETTAGGHYRFRIEDVRAQLRARQKRSG